jgi:hypothetical protein
MTEKNPKEKAENLCKDTMTKFEEKFKEDRKKGWEEYNSEQHF